jgi:polyisoprenoid-binding protein YceI
MNARNIIGIASLGLVLGVSVGFMPRQSAPLPASPAAHRSAAASFAVDPVHSSLIFKIEHMGIANFYGRFNNIDGEYRLDEGNPADCQFNFTVKADSVDTANQRRDGHLKSADFFNVAEYPTITFKSTKVERAGDMQLKVTGDLNLHGETKPVTADVKIFTAKETQQGVKGGLETTFTIKRSDHGMNYGVSEGALGDNVTITMAIEAARK